MPHVRRGAKRRLGWRLMTASGHPSPPLRKAQLPASAIRSNRGEARRLRTGALRFACSLRARTATSGCCPRGIPDDELRTGRGVVSRDVEAESIRADEFARGGDAPLLGCRTGACLNASGAAPRGSARVDAKVAVHLELTRRQVLEPLVCLSVAGPDDQGCTGGPGSPTQRPCSDPERSGSARASLCLPMRRRQRR